MTCVYCIYLIRVHWYWHFSLGVICKISVGRIQIINTYLIPPQACGSLWQWWRLCGYTYHNQFIDGLSGNNIKVLVTVWCFWRIFGFEVGQRGTTDHWVNTLKTFQHSNLNVIVKVCCLQRIIFRVVKRGTKSYWVNPLFFFQENNVKVFVTLWCFRKVQDNITKKDTYDQLVVIIKKYVAAASILSLQGNKNKKI